MALSIPFVSSAIRSGGSAIRAFKSGQPMKALHHGASATGDVALPILIGKEVANVVKETKMTNKELERLHKRAGFLKEASIAKEAIVGSALRAAWKHKKGLGLLGLGAAGGAATVGTAAAIRKASIENRRLYAPKYRYRRELA